MIAVNHSCCTTPPFHVCPSPAVVPVVIVAIALPLLVAWAILKRRRIAARRHWQRDEEEQYSARSGHLASDRLLGRYPGTTDRGAPEDAGNSSASGGHLHKHPGPARRDLLSVLLCECHEGPVPHVSPGGRGCTSGAYSVYDGSSRGTYRASDVSGRGAGLQPAAEEGQGGEHGGQRSAAQREGESHHLTAVSRRQSNEMTASMH
jgi:hypothetical protein